MALVSTLETAVLVTTLAVGASLSTAIDTTDVTALVIGGSSIVTTMIGSPGPRGERGERGLDGKDGVGKDGRDGVDGLPGRNGVDGQPGRDGTDGRDGADGNNGRDGIDGDTSPGASLPAGGLQGQLLAKRSNMDGDAQWTQSPASFPILIVGRYASGVNFQNISGAFTTIEINNITSDTHGGWNASDHTYTVPEHGLYELQGKLRLGDNTQAGYNHGIGLDVRNEDSPGFVWGSFPGGGSSNRYTLSNTRVLYLFQGEKVRLFAYGDGAPTGVNAGELVVQRIR